MSMNTLLKPFVIFIALLIAACSSSDDDDDSMAEYEIKVYNITNNQPLTPIAVIAHKNTFMPWQLGMAATIGLEKLAESGDNSDFISESEMDSAVLATAASTGGPIMPGSMATINLKTKMMSDLQISLATMLANTNDAFTGIANWKVTDLTVNQSKILMTHVFDAGTEKNSEMPGTIPGPAVAGEGFNPARDDMDRIIIHPGVVTEDDGLMTSALNESHRWMGPAAKVVVTRKQ